MKASFPNIDLHFKLLEKIKSARDIATKKRLCIQDVDLFPKFKRDYLKQADFYVERDMEADKLVGKKHLKGYYKRKFAKFYKIPRYPSFKDLAVIYEKEGDYRSAIKVCKEAIRARQIDDGTQGGMRERLKKLKAKL